MIRKTIPQLDISRSDYESEIKHLVAMSIKNVVAVRDEKIIELLKKYQEAMVILYLTFTRKGMPSSVIVDVIIQKGALGTIFKLIIDSLPLEVFINKMGLNENSFQNYPFGSNPSPFLDRIGISSYKAPRRAELKEKVKFYF